MWLTKIFRKKNTQAKDSIVIHADAVVLSVLPGNKLQLHVFPYESRNFVTEVITYSPVSSYLCAGQRLRIKYFRSNQNKIEILEQTGL